MSLNCLLIINLIELIMFVATLRGKGVWRGCSLFKIFYDTAESTLDTLGKEISSRYEIDVSDFNIIHGELKAYTSNEDIEVFIEEVDTL